MSLRGRCCGTVRHSVGRRVSCAHPAYEAPTSGAPGVPHSRLSAPVTIASISADPSSRLGCQVYLKPELDGMVARLPAATRNMYVDGECS